MIDWLSLALDGAWVFGMDVILATVSLAYGKGDGELSPRLDYLAAGACLFSVGMAGNADTWCLSFLWGALAILAAIQGWRLRRSCSERN